MALSKRIFLSAISGARSVYLADGSGSAGGIAVGASAFGAAAVVGAAGAVTGVG